MDEWLRRFIIDVIANTLGELLADLARKLLETLNKPRGKHFNR